MFANAKNICFKTGVFDIVICGFMDWGDFFNFTRMEFFQPDTKISEIHRVLHAGGRFVCCSWEGQEDVTWMESSVLRHFLSIMDGADYRRRRPIGMSYEKAEGYEFILKYAGFTNVMLSRETAEFISTDEEQWWRQMENIGWDIFFCKLEE